jgi:uncharacterized protein
MRLLMSAALMIAALLSALLALVWFAQEQLIFRPTATAPEVTLAREPDVHEGFVDVPGARLSVLQLRLPQPRGVVFFLHGNAGNLQSWFVNTAFYRQANFDLVMLDYRGYGKSSGRIQSEAQLQADVLAVWQQVAPRYADKKRVIYGRSLGTGLAAALPAQAQPDLTVLVSPYRSLVALAAEHYPFVPQALLRYRLRTDDALPRITRPVLLMHGERDTLIPPAHSAQLLPLARAGQRVVVAGAAHNDLQDFAPYRSALAEALAALR